MNTEASRLARTFRRNLDLIARCAEGVPEAAAHLRAGEGSSLNWVVGHCLASRTRLLETLDVPSDGEGVRARYGVGTLPDPANALPLPDLLTRLEEAQTQLENVLPDADLTLLIESPFGAQSLAELLDYFAWHEATHAGQLAVLRRVSGLPSAEG